MSEHSFIAFYTKITATAQAPASPRPLPDSRTNSCPFLTLRITQLPPLPLSLSEGSEETPARLPQQNCCLWPVLAAPWAEAGCPHAHSGHVGAGRGSLGSFLG